MANHVFLSAHACLAIRTSHTHVSVSVPRMHAWQSAPVTHTYPYQFRACMPGNPHQSYTRIRISSVKSVRQSAPHHRQVQLIVTSAFRQRQSIPRVCKDQGQGSVHATHYALALVGHGPCVKGTYQGFEVKIIKGSMLRPAVKECRSISRLSALLQTSCNQLLCGPVHGNGNKCQYAYVRQPPRESSAYHPCQ